MKDERRVDWRFSPALAFVTSEEEIFVCPDGAAESSSELVKTQSIETWRGEQVLCIQIVVPEILVERAVGLIGS